MTNKCVCEWGGDLLIIDFQMTKETSECSKGEAIPKPLGIMSDEGTDERG